MSYVFIHYSNLSQFVYLLRYNLLIIFYNYQLFVNAVYIVISCPINTKYTPDGRTNTAMHCVTLCRSPSSGYGFIIRFYLFFDWIPQGQLIFLYEVTP
jgi:hypothetical protein